MKRRWDRLKSGLFVPELLRRVHRDEDGAWWPCCGAGEEACPNCSGTGNNAPGNYSIVFAGIANDNCGECGDFNTGSPYVASWFGYDEPSGECRYRYTFPGGGPCGASWIGLWIKPWVYIGPAGYEIIVSIRDADGLNSIARFVEVYPDKPNCLTLANEAITYHGKTVNDCDNTIATCQITAA